jgi:hypothetical protein
MEPRPRDEWRRLARAYRCGVRGTAAMERQEGRRRRRNQLIAASEGVAFLPPSRRGVYSSMVPRHSMARHANAASRCENAVGDAARLAHMGTVAMRGSSTQERSRTRLMWRHSVPTYDSRVVL